MTPARKVTFSHNSKVFKFVKNTEFGGAKFDTYNPTGKRPLAANTPVHVVFKSEIAKGKLSMHNFDARIQQIIKRQAGLFGIELKEFVNAGDHLHLVVVLPSLSVWHGFICAIGGLIARVVTGRERGQATAEKAVAGPRQKFWKGRPWTRLVARGTDLRGVSEYLHHGDLDALGFSRRSPLVIRSMKLDDVVL